MPQDSTSSLKCIIPTCRSTTLLRVQLSAIHRQPIISDGCIEFWSQSKSVSFPEEKDHSRFVIGDCAFQVNHQLLLPFLRNKDKIGAAACRPGQQRERVQAAGLVRALVNLQTHARQGGKGCAWQTRHWGPRSQGERTRYLIREEGNTDRR